MCNWLAAADPASRAPSQHQVSILFLLPDAAALWCYCNYGRSCRPQMQPMCPVRTCVLCRFSQLPQPVQRLGSPIVAFITCRHRCTSYSMTSVTLQVSPSSSTATFSLASKRNACVCRVHSSDRPLVGGPVSPASSLCTAQCAGPHLIGRAWHILHQGGKVVCYEHYHDLCCTPGTAV